MRVGSGPQKLPAAWITRSSGRSPSVDTDVQRGVASLGHVNLFNAEVSKEAEPYLERRAHVSDASLNFCLDGVSREHVFDMVKKVCDLVNVVELLTVLVYTFQHLVQLLCNLEEMKVNKEISFQYVPH